jgi:hypothetical protein
VYGGFTSSAELLMELKETLSLSILHMLLSKLSYSLVIAYLLFHGYYMKGGALSR